VAKEIKNIKKKHAETRGLSKVAQQIIDKEPARVTIRRQSPIFCTERIPGVDAATVKRLTLSADRELVPELLRQSTEPARSGRGVHGPGGLPVANWQLLDIESVQRMDEGSQREPAMNQITLPSGRVTEKRLDKKDSARSPLFAAQSRLSHIDLFRSLEL